MTASAYKMYSLSGLVKCVSVASICSNQQFNMNAMQHQAGCSNHSASRIHYHGMCVSVSLCKPVKYLLYKFKVLFVCQCGISACLSSTRLHIVPLRAITVGTVARLANAGVWENLPVVCDINCNTCSMHLPLPDGMIIWFTFSMEIHFVVVLQTMAQVPDTKQARQTG